MQSPDISLIFPSSPFLLNQAVFPPLGIMYLSASLKHQGFNVQCLDGGLGDSLDDIKSDIVGISFSSPQRSFAFDMAKKLRDQGKTLIAGGPHPTHMPEECKNNGFHFVVQGEGERQLSKLLWMLNGKSWKAGTEACNPVELPYPDRDSLPIWDYKYEIDGTRATVIMTSRSCPFNCSFCAKLPETYRAQSAFRTVREIMHVHEQYGFRGFMIFDDCFTVDKKRLRDIATCLSIANFKFRCFSRSNLIDEDTCKYLQVMGVREVGFGAESGSDEVLKKNMKGTSSKMNTQAVKLLHKYGIRAKAFLIVGLPGETYETVEDTKKWIKQAEPDDIDVSVFQPLPGSPIFKYPDHYEVSFNYNGDLMWFKGTPGLYISTCRTKELSGEEIVRLRDEMEKEFKKKELLR